MGAKYLNIAEFKLEGEFLHFIGTSTEKFKALSLQVASTEVKILLTKDLRSSLCSWLIPGYKIYVSGVMQLHLKTEKMKLRAYNVTLIGSTFNHSNNQQPTTKATTKILVCQGDSCRKKGGQGLLSNLEQKVCEHGLHDRIAIERSNCLKNCRKGPYCVVKRGKNKYATFNMKINNFAEEFVVESIE